MMSAIKMTPEARAHNSASKVRYYAETPGAREHNVEAQKLCQMRPDVRAKKSVGQKAWCSSPEGKAKLSAGQQRRREREREERGEA